MFETDPRRRWYTKTQAATEAGVTVRTINRWIAAGHLALRLGHINAHELFAVEAAQRQKRNQRRRHRIRLPA